MADHSFDIENSLGSLIGRTAKLMGRLLEANFRKAGHNLSLEHWLVLVHLWQQDGRSQSELGWECGRTKTTITRAVDALEQQNYVLRVTDRTDRRNKLIYLTHQGKQLQDELLPVAQESLVEATRGIPPDEVERGKCMLRKLFNNLTAT